MTEAKPTPLQKRFEAAVAMYARNPTQKNRERMVMAERRMHGVAMRNARKLARRPQNRGQ